jgi:phospholipid/cholesterol/gamma-HCH transport system substrate-binding protein
VSTPLTISKEARIGITVSAAILLFIIGFNYLKGKNLFTKARTFYAEYERVDGLLPSAPVQVNGLKVGLVDDVYFNPKRGNSIVVRFLVTDKSLIIPENSEVKIISDLFGVRTINLVLGASQEYAKSGDTLVAGREITFTEAIGNTIKPLQARTESLVASIDSVLEVITNVFNKKTQDGLVSSFESVNSSILKLEHTVTEVDLLVTNERGKLGDIFTHLRSITQNLASNNQKITNLFTNIETISDDVARSNVKETMEKLQLAITHFEHVIGNIKNGEGSLGQMAVNDSLYKNLESGAKNLDLLLEDMRLNPKRYVHFSVFGKKEK